MLSNKQLLVFVLCLAFCVIGNDAGTLAGLEIKEAKFCGKINENDDADGDDYGD